MAACYGKAEITERHRHRYEFNNDYRQLLADAGLVISGTSPDGSIVETVEVPENDFFVRVCSSIRNSKAGRINRIHCFWD